MPNSVCLAKVEPRSPCGLVCGLGESVPWIVWNLHMRTADLLKRISFISGMLVAIKVVGAVFFVTGVARAGSQTIKPGDLWPDDRGRHVQAHGGGIIKI